MKKIWILAIIMVVVLALTACNRNNTPVEPDVTTPVNDENGQPIDEDIDEDIGENDNEEDNSDEIDEDEDNNDEDENDEDENDDEDEDENNEDEDDNEDDETPVVVIPARPANVVYSLSTDIEFQNIPVGTRGASEDVLTTDYLLGAGNPTFRAVANPSGGVALRIDNREENWHGVDIITSELGLNTAANSYQLTVRGNIAEAGNVIISGGDAPHATLFSHATAAGDFTLQFTMTATTIENSGSRGHVRIAANNHSNLEIREIEVRRVDLVAPVVVPTRPANVVYSLATDEGFQNSIVGLSGDGMAVLGETPYLQNSGSPSFTIVDNPVGSGNALRVHGRTADWHTIDLMIDNMETNPSANTYTIRVRGRIIDPPPAVEPNEDGEGGEASSFDIMGSDRPWARFASVEVSGDGNFTAVANNVNAATMAENGASNGRIRLAASGLAGSTVFYIYELEVTRN